MANIIGYSEVQKVYLDLTNDKLTLVLFGVSVTIGLFYTIYKIVNTYIKDLTENETVNVHKLILAFKPYLVYMLLIVLFPVIINYIELILGEIERLILNKTGKEPIDLITHAKTELDLYNYNGGSIFTMSGYQLVSYLTIMIIKPIMVFIDSYLFAFVLALRFFYLLYLEILAPMAIISLAFSDKVFFKSWLNNMFACYLYVPAFMLANSFAEAIYSYMVNNSYETLLALIFLIALKIALYGTAKKLTDKLVFV